MIAVFFFYGLAFFVMGLALAFASRLESQLHFVKAIRPLAAFGILHGIHEWIDMFQLIANQTNGHTPTPFQEVCRLLVLVLSFMMLLLFGVLLPESHPQRRVRAWAFVGLVGLWSVSVVAIFVWRQPDIHEFVKLADVLARYILGIPATVLGAIALMMLQRTFREHDMPQFGRDLVWSATALFFYGVVGQLFVQKTILFPSQWLNSELFLQWFGIPVQLFRGSMAVALTITMLRALRALDLENRRRLENARQTELAAQSRTLEAERRLRHEHEQLNQEIQLQARELALLLDLSNRLAAPTELGEQLTEVLRQVVHNLPFSDAGMILLVPQGGGSPTVEALTGFATTALDATGARYGPSLEIAERCFASGKAVCCHMDGVVVEFSLEGALFGEECWQYPSPTVSIALPLVSQTERVGAIVLARAKKAERILSLADLKLLAGIARQLGLSIENVRLYQQAQERETLLANLLSQVVGAQEAERQRIARDLHDATGQSLTAISLGLRGLENSLAGRDPRLQESFSTLQLFATDAIGELRRIISDLRPPQLDDLGLIPALRWSVQAFRQRYAEIEVELSIAGENVRLSRHVETSLFRIVQEAMTNIAKHAGATHVVVAVQINPTSITLSVKDNGRGFVANQLWKGQPSGWGILGIRERAKLLGADCTIVSEPGQGTHVEIRAPLTGEPNVSEPALAQVAAESQT